MEEEVGGITHSLTSLHLTLGLAEEVHELDRSTPSIGAISLSAKGALALSGMVTLCGFAAVGLSLVGRIKELSVSVPLMTGPFLLYFGCLGLTKSLNWIAEERLALQSTQAERNSTKLAISDRTKGWTPGENLGATATLEDVNNKIQFYTNRFSGPVNRPRPTPPLLSSVALDWAKSLVGAGSIAMGAALISLAAIESAALLIKGPITLFDWPLFDSPLTTTSMWMYGSCFIGLGFLAKENDEGSRVSERLESVGTWERWRTIVRQDIALGYLKPRNDDKSHLTTPDLPPFSRPPEVGIGASLRELRYGMTKKGLFAHLNQGTFLSAGLIALLSTFVVIAHHSGDILGRPLINHPGTLGQISSVASSCCFTALSAAVALTAEPGKNEIQAAKESREEELERRERLKEEIPSLALRSGQPQGRIPFDPDERTAASLRALQLLGGAIALSGVGLIALVAAQINAAIRGQGSIRLFNTALKADPASICQLFGTSSFTILAGRGIMNLSSKRAESKHQAARWRHAQGLEEQVAKIQMGILESSLADE